LGGYLPYRAASAANLYTINRANLQPFLSAQVAGHSPTLVFVYPDDWMDYGNLLELSSPFDDSHYIFALGGNQATEDRIQAAYPDRQVLYYYADRPGLLYTIKHNQP
jgi:hypothetical protein